jgi:hypothetical protein
MSSRLGSIGLNDYGQWETYRLSKAALDHGRAQLLSPPPPSYAVLSIAPGWCAPTWVGHRQLSMSETSCRNVANAIEQHGRTPRPSLRELRRRRVTLVSAASASNPKFAHTRAAKAVADSRRQKGQ